jgi:hypothetical protein
LIIDVLELEGIFEERFMGASKLLLGNRSLVDQPDPSDELAKMEVIYFW